MADIYMYVCVYYLQEYLLFIDLILLLCIIKELLMVYTMHATCTCSSLCGCTTDCCCVLVPSTSIVTEDLCT